MAADRIRSIIPRKSPAFLKRQAETNIFQGLFNGQK